MIWYGIVLHWIIDQDSSICTISYHEEDVQFWNAFSLSLHRLYFATNLFYVALQALNFFFTYLHNDKLWGLPRRVFTLLDRETQILFKEKERVICLKIDSKFSKNDNYALTQRFL